MKSKNNKANIKYMIGVALALVIIIIMYIYEPLIINHNVINRQHVTESDLYIEKANLLKEYEVGTIKGSTIKDINSDGDMDIIISWEPQSGCCLRNIDDVYLYKYTDGAVARVNSEPIEIMNPYYIDNNTIINMNYGQPGGVNMMEKKWRGYILDNVATLTPLNFDISTNRFEFEKKGEDTIIIDSNMIDNKYISYPYFKWFIGQI